MALRSYLPTNPLTVVPLVHRYRRALFHRLRGSRGSDVQPWSTDCRRDPRIPGVAAAERQRAVRHLAHGRPTRRSRESFNRPYRTPGAVSQESLASRRDAQIGRGPVRAGSAKARSMDWNGQREHRDGRTALSLHQIWDARYGRTRPRLDRFLRTSLCFDGCLERVPQPGSLDGSLGDGIGHSHARRDFDRDQSACAGALDRLEVGRLRVLALAVQKEPTLRLALRPAALQVRR